MILLEDARLAVLDDLGSCIPEIPFQTFMDHLAPPQPDFDLEATITSLKSASILTALDRWTVFDKAPKDRDCSEDAAFKPIPDIFTQVVGEIVANSRSKLTKGDRSTDFVQNPSRAPTSAERHNASRPDGYLLVKDRKPGGVSWADVVLSCEYKWKDGDEELDDDVRKCLWSLQHVMRDDPRRRATFGMTIENSTTRVWFCCRSSTVVSEAFDFITEPTKIIKLFAAFAFADEKSLGFDPTVQRAEDDDKQFIISVHPDNDTKNPRTFRTKRIISSYGAEPLRGRGTRVFEAIEIGPNGVGKDLPVVLKDIWIDHDRMREGAILALLHSEASNEDKRLVEKHFLTTICHGDVWTQLNVLDDTENALMRGLKITTDREFKLQRKQLVFQKHEPASGSEGLRAISRLRAPHSHLKYAHKTHYRIVFAEKGITVDLIKSLPDVMTVLTETVNALQLLRKLGWVHRDVSVGNILSCNGGAKLADLEYAKKVGDVKSHEMRTGTMHFMSIEVAAQMFLFAPRRSHPSANFIQKVQEIKQLKERAAANIKRDKPANLPFAHNHLHDLESLWWVAVWIVFYNHFSKSQQLDEEPLSDLQVVKRQVRLAGTLFPSVMNSTDRQNGFQTSFSQVCENLPRNKDTICTYLEALRTTLVDHYTAIESTLPKSITSTASEDDIYEEFKEALTASCKDYSDFMLTFIPHIHAQFRGYLKRPRAESTNDTEAVTQRRR